MPNTQRRSTLKLRVRSLTIDGYKLKKIEIAGRFPRSASRKDVAFIVSLFDGAEDEIHPIISNEPEFREPFTVVYQSRVMVGKISARSNYIHEWVPIAVFPPECMMGPYGGKRKLVAVVRLEDTDNPLNIVRGNVVGEEDETLWSSKIRFVCSLYEDGYIKAAKRCRRIESIAIRLALAIAIEDGKLDYRVINVVKKRVEQWSLDAAVHIDGLSSEQRASSYRGMMGRALKQAKTNGIDTVALLKSMQRCAGTRLWYETLELCYDVISANGVADSKQFHHLHEIAASSGLDEKRLEELRDKKLIGFKVQSMVESSVEEFLGIDDSWDREKRRRYLRREYRKWNGRMNMISEGEARENAQGILNMIGEAYKKYTLPESAPPIPPKADPAPQIANQGVQLELFNDTE